MVYKMISPRPLKIDINKMNIIRKLFMIDLIQIIAKPDIYISIDEWTTLDSIRAKDFLPLEQQEREQQENWDWISIKK